MLSSVNHAARPTRLRAARGSRHELAPAGLRQHAASLRERRSPHRRGPGRFAMLTSQSNLPLMTKDEELWVTHVPIIRASQEHVSRGNGGGVIGTVIERPPPAEECVAREAERTGSPISRIGW